MNNVIRLGVKSATLITIFGVLAVCCIGIRNRALENERLDREIAHTRLLLRQTNRSVAKARIKIKQLEDKLKPQAPCDTEEWQLKPE